MECQYCGKICKSNNSLAQHTIRCAKNPDRIKCESGFKGKTHSTEVRNALSNRSKELHAAGVLKSPPSFLGKKHTDATKKKQAKSFAGKIPDTLFDVSSRTLQKILKRMGVKCSNCGWDKTTCDVHHIVPRKDGGTNENTNLTILCPNCHRMAHEHKLTEMINIEKQYGDKWREFYFSHK